MYYGEKTNCLYIYKIDVINGIKMVYEIEVDLAYDGYRGRESPDYETALAETLVASGVKMDAVFD
jgi:hypothetical protein